MFVNSRVGVFGVVRLSVGVCEQPSSSGRCCEAVCLCLLTAGFE